MSDFEKLNEDENLEETASNEEKSDAVKDVELAEATSTKEANEIDKVPSEENKETNEAVKSVVDTKPQRKLKLNRRGLYLAHSPTANQEKNKDGAEKPSDINGSNNDSAAKAKTEVPKKVISLRSVKRNLPEQTLEPVKRKFEKITFGSSVKKEGSASAKTRSNETSETSSAKDLPPEKKQKHQPITWP